MNYWLLVDYGMWDQSLGHSCCNLLFPAEELKGDLDRYVQAELQGKVKVLRNQRREGLIRGRMIGAAHASGTSREGTVSEGIMK